MENASKALIIAGAILLAILIISLGIMIYNQAAGVVNNGAMTETEIATFNNKFQQYLGEKVRGATVRSLIDAAAANNMTFEDDESKTIYINGEAAISTMKTTFKSGNSYKVVVASSGDIKDYTNGGLIHNINITEAK